MPDSRPRLTRDSAASLPLVALAVCIGVLGATGAAVFHHAVDASTWLFRGHTAALGGAAIPLALMAGGVCLLALERFFPGDVLGYGFPRFLEMLHLERGYVKRRWMFLKTIGTAISLGAGASVGREGPIAQIGGSIAAAVARLARRSTDERKVLIACGTAAGIAANFNAPIGAVMFAQEVVLLGEVELARISLVVVSAATAVATTRGFFGTQALFQVLPFELRSHWELITYAMLGVVLGLLAVVYTRSFHAAVDWTARQRWSQATKLLGGLALVAAVGVAFPQNLADGYPIINEALGGSIAWQLAAALAVAKCVTSIISLACGAPGGVFGPIFFIGAMTGASFRALSEALWPMLTGPRGSYALVGLGGFLAATTHAPFTALFLLFEITGSYSVTVPALLGVGISLLISHRLEPESIDTYGLTAHGTHLQRQDFRVAMEMEPIGDDYRHGVETVAENCPLPAILRILSGSDVTTLPVVSENGALAGVVSFTNLRSVLLEQGLGSLVIARDLCEPLVPTLTPHSSVAEAFRHFEASGFDALPVVDAASSRRVLGMLSRGDLIAAYNRIQTEQPMAEVGSWLRTHPEWAGRYGVATIPVPTDWLGRSLREIDCRGQFGVTVLAVRGASGSDDDYEIPDPDRRLAPGDVIALAGSRERLRALHRAVAEDVLRRRADREG